jgi:hypothetical protein
MSLDKEDISYLKEVFVAKDECNRTVALENEKINELALIEARNGTKLSILIGILAAIAVPILTLSVKMLFGN